jgi:TatD family-associated radical SAM protein
LSSVEGAIAYRIGNSLYLNVTNKCSNACTFCVRTKSDGVGGHYLWLRSEPTVEKVMDEIQKQTLPGETFDEYVFCGYGEPLERLDAVVGVAAGLKKMGPCTIRLNTNGHGNLINGRNVVPELEGLIDVASISLNAESPEKYHSICNSIYGPDAFGAMLFFAEQCKRSGIRVVMSVVDVPEIDIDACRAIVEELGVELRVRSMIQAG